MEWLCSVVEASSVTSAAARLQSGVCLEQLVPLWHFGGVGGVGGWWGGGTSTSLLYSTTLLMLQNDRLHLYLGDCDILMSLLGLTTFSFIENLIATHPSSSAVSI